MEDNRLASIREASNGYTLSIAEEGGTKHIIAKGFDEVIRELNAYFGIKAE